MLKKFKSKQDKEVMKNITGAIILKGLGLIISFASMPVYIKFFNNDEVLGLWFTILSILTWVLTFDFGIGNGLRNHLVKPIEDKDTRSIKEYISSAYITLGFFTLLLVIILIPVALLLNWNVVLNISNEIVNNNVLKYVIIINLFTVMLQFFFRIISAILYALQLSTINNLLAFITSLTQLLFAIFYVGKSASDNLVVLSYVHLVCVNLPLIVATVLLFSKRLKGMWPSFKMFDKEKAKPIFLDGSKILINQILYLVLTATNAYLITSLISNTQVVEYEQYYRIFMLMGTLYLLILTPLWSAVTKANNNKDYEWIMKYFKLTILGSFLVLLAQFLIVPLLQFVFNIWLGAEAPTANYGYASVFALYGFVFTFQSTVSTFAMGFNKTKLQAIMYAIAVVIKIITIAILLQFYKLWVIMIIADVLAFMPYCIIEFFDIKNVISNKLEKVIVLEEIVDKK